MFWTGVRRDAGSVLAEQQGKTPQNIEGLRAMRDHAHALRQLVCDGFDPLAFGRVLDETWRLKRRLASTITSEQIDAWYSQARTAGAVGGKICGAGGGGFLLLLVPQERQETVRAALSGMVEVPIRYEAQGSRILLPFVE